MHYSPGAPVLHSRDLVNWEYISHSVPTLAWDSKYDLDGSRAYIDGIWASSIAYRESTGLFYWLGCIDFGTTYIYTSTSPSGPWEQASSIAECYYDAGILIDDDDTMYVAYGNSQISVAQMSSDGLSQVSTVSVYSTPSDIGTLEGARFYKKDGQYYIWLTRPANGQYVIKSGSAMSGYSSAHEVLLDMPTPIYGAGVPHQGSLVDTQTGDWYYMAFVDAYPGGRVPVLAPITWDGDGWPVITTVNGGWGAEYPLPLSESAVEPTTGTDSFSGTQLQPAWEWNHNPDTGSFAVNDGLTLSAATITDDLYAAKNTLSKRIHGPVGTGTLELDISGMASGDRAGLALLRHQSAYVGVARDGDTFTVVYVDGLTMNVNWETTGTGTVGASESIQSGTVWLRIEADIAPGSTKQAMFYYSIDGSSFSPIGSSFTMNSDWQFFMGYRYGIFEFATQSLGGSVKVVSFTSE